MELEITKIETDMKKPCIIVDAELRLNFNPERVNLDFEIAAMKAFRESFPATVVSCCRFHLGQSWFRKIQKLGLTTEYKDMSCEISRWLSYFFGL